MSAEPNGPQDLTMPWWLASEAAHPRGSNRYEQARIDAARRRVDRYLVARREEVDRLLRVARSWPRRGRWAMALAAARRRPACTVRAFAGRLEWEIERRTARLDLSGSRGWLACTGYEGLDRPPPAVAKALEDIAFAEGAINEAVLAAAWAELARHRIARSRYHLLLRPWRTVFDPAEMPPARRWPRPPGPDGPPADPASLAGWRALCDWLEAMPYNASYSPPSRFAPLLGLSSRRLRVELALVFWSAGHGWRLRKHYAARLAELEGGAR